MKYPDPLAPIESDINITFGRVFDIARSEHPDAASHLQSAAQQDTTAETFGSAAAQFGPGGGGAGEALATISVTPAASSKVADRRIAFEHTPVTRLLATPAAYKAGVVSPFTITSSLARSRVHAS